MPAEVIEGLRRLRNNIRVSLNVPIKVSIKESVLKPLLKTPQASVSPPQNNLYTVYLRVFPRFQSHSEVSFSNREQIRPGYLKVWD